jgi:hypothetical protein
VRLADSVSGTGCPVGLQLCALRFVGAVLRVLAGHQSVVQFVLRARVQQLAGDTASCPARTLITNCT